MLVLGLETATQVVGVAIGNSKGVLASFHSTRERRHAETLAPAIDFVCRQAQVDLGEIGAVVVDVGPGSFTGLRVGLAAAKAIAYARNVPMAGLCSLDLIAYRARVADRVILSIIDARRDELYYALYRRASGEVQRLTEPRVGPISEITGQLKALGEGCLALGDGVQRYAQLLRESGPVEVVCKGFRFPDAESLVEIGAEKAARGEVVPESEIQPLYLRPPDAKPSW
jgi:tRNA threonylcarbamoyladenosine biosynthesis protein TsaB